MGDVNTPIIAADDADATGAVRALPKPRALIFDWDNTLVDTWPCIGRATNITLEAMGHPAWTESEIRARVAGSLRDTFPKIYGDRWEEARDIYYKAFAAVHLEMLAALPDAEALLRYGRDAGLYMGVVSNKTGTYLRQEAAHLGWDHYFGRLVGSQDAARDKPAPDPIWMVLKDSGIESAGPDVWFIGDAAIDVACGRAAGCTTVLVHRREPEAEPHGHAEDCPSLMRLLRAALVN